MKRTSLLVILLALPACPQVLSSVRLENPSAPGSLQPNWSAAPDGAAVFSWVEPAKDGSYALRYAVRRGGTWSAATTIVARRRFFRHPAEMPEVIATAKGHWLAHWEESPQDGSDAEYLYVSSSADGTHWIPPTQAHRDRSPVQHGLASMSANPDGTASLFWLQALKGEDGPTSLMRTIVDGSGKEVREEHLDDDVCSCCPTAVARTSKGLIVAYRDHTRNNIRDIAVTRFEDGHWTPGKIVNGDNWEIDACPTNAAAIAAKGDHVVVAWFTAAQDKPRELVAFSNDNGASFTKPVTLSLGHAFGYTALALDEDGAIISWLEQSPEGARVLVRHVTPNRNSGPVFEVAKGGRAALGYPKLFHRGSETYIAWGDSRGLQTVMLVETQKLSEPMPMIDQRTWLASFSQTRAQ